MKIAKSNLKHLYPPRHLNDLFRIRKTKANNIFEIEKKISEIDFFRIVTCENFYKDKNIQITFFLSFDLDNLVKSKDNF